MIPLTLNSCIASHYTLHSFSMNEIHRLSSVCRECFIYVRGGQNLVCVEYWIRKLKLGPGLGWVVKTPNLFVSSFFHTVKSHYLFYGQE